MATEVMRNNIWAKRLVKLAVMTVACLIYGASVSLFLDPNSLAPGGVTGIAIILNHVTGIETGTWVLLINIPILLVGIWKFKLRFILSTLYCTALTSIVMNLLAPLGAVTTDPLLSAISGGTLMALGLGMIMRMGATTGGTDIIVKLLRLGLPHLKTGFLFLVTDAIVVTLSALVFQNVDVALYAGIVVLVNSVVLDRVLYGCDGAKLIYIVSDKHEEIAKRLLTELDLGVTYLAAKGAYSGREKQMIICAMRKSLSPKAEDVVRKEDPTAFMIVTNATEIYGEGYKSFFGQKL